MLASASSNSLSNPERNAGVSFDHRRWSWQQWHHPTKRQIKQGPTTRGVWKPWTKKTRKPKTTLAPTPGPEICQNRTKVSSVDEEPGKVVCLRRNSTELLSQLRSVGGYIELYMAVNVSQACGFQDLTNFIDEGPMITNPPDTTMSSTSTSTGRPTVRNLADEQTQSDESLERRKRSIPTTPGTNIRGCQGRGTIPDGTNLRRLCTECAATTRLPDDRYPPYINEVICRDSDRQCAARMGICYQRQLRFPFLQLTGRFQIDTLLSQLTGKTIYKEVWVPYTQEIRSCCECRVYSFVYQSFATRSRG